MKRWGILISALVLCAVLTGCGPQQALRVIFPFWLPELRQFTTPEETATAIEQYATLAFEVPETWDKIEKTDNTYYYTPDKDFLMLGTDELDEPFNERYIEDFIAGFGESFDDFHEIRHRLHEIDGLTSLRLEFRAEVSGQDVLCYTELIQNGSQLISFAMITLEDSTADNRTDFDNIVHSIEAVYRLPYGD